MRQAYLKNLLFSYSPFLVHIAVTILITPFAVHHLGEFEYAILVIFNTLLGYLGLANIGTPQTLVRRLIGYNSRGEIDKAEGIISTLFVTYSGMILLLGLLAWLLISHNLFDVAGRIVQDVDGLTSLRSTALPLILVFAFDLWRLLFDSVLIAHNKIYISKLLIAALMLTRGVALYLVLLRGGSLEQVLLAYAGLAAAFAIIFYLVAGRVQRFRLSPGSCRWKYLRDILPDSVWYFVGGIAVVLIFQTDSLVVSALVSVSAVTGYALMFRYVDIVGRMLSNIVVVLFPEAARLFEQKDYRGLLRLHDRLITAMLPLALVVLGVFYLLGERVFALWMGGLELFDGQLFLVFLITNSLLLISAPATNFIEAVGWHRFSTKLALLQGALNLGLSIALATRYGSLGVALGTLIALVVTSFPGNILYFRHRLRKVVSDS